MAGVNTKDLTKHCTEVTRLSRHATLASAFAAIGTDTVGLIIDRAEALTSNVSSPSTCPCTFVQGGTITTTGWVLSFGTIPKIDMLHAFAGTGRVNGLPFEVYPEWWGALGNGELGEGATDDAAAINIAYLHAHYASSTLKMGPKRYRIRSTVRFGLVGDNPATNCGIGNVSGTDVSSTIIEKEGNFTGVIANLGNGAFMEKFQVVGIAGNGGIGIKIINGNRIKASRIRSAYHASHGIQLTYGMIGCYDSITSQLNGGDGFNIYDQYNRGAGSEAVTSNTFISFDLLGNTGWGMNVESGSWNEGSGIVIQENIAGGIRFDHAVANTMSVYVESNGIPGTVFTENTTRNHVNYFAQQSGNAMSNLGTDNTISGSGESFIAPMAIVRLGRQDDGDGDSLNVYAGMAGTSGTSNRGGDLSLGGGNGNSGGHVYVRGGSPRSGEYGSVYLNEISGCKGNIILGNVNGSGVPLGHVDAHYPLRFIPMTTTVRNLLTPSIGTLFYNSTLGKLQVFTAAGWETITSAT